MKAVAVFLLMVSPVWAGAYRALFLEDRQALEPQVVIPVQKQVLEIYGTPNCRRCVTAHRELSADAYVISNYTIEKKSAGQGMRTFPQFYVRGGKTTYVGYPSKGAVLKWLKTQEEEKR